MSASGKYSCALSHWHYYLMIGDVCRDNYFLEYKKDIIEI